MPNWRIQVFPQPNQPDPLARQTWDQLADFGVQTVESVASARVYLLEIDKDDRDTIHQVADLLTDPVVEDWSASREGDDPTDPENTLPVEVYLKPGVMDPAGHSTVLALEDMGVPVRSVRTGRRFELTPIPSDHERASIKRLLGNDCIEEVIFGTKPAGPPPQPPEYALDPREIAILRLSDAELAALSRDQHLFLSTDELKTIQAHFDAVGREPTDLELETLAQTWSEHCVHKTLKASYQYRGAPFPSDANPEPETTRAYDNLLRDTIVRATRELITEKRGPECLSIFEDNAGVIGFDDDLGVAFKVETHNHPSAIEPYGGAATGAGGVIRDILGCGLGAKPIAMTDIFCVAPPDWPIAGVPRGIIHPKTVLKGIVSGVRDYGNRMGIPTVNGAVHFDPRYLGNPLVYCGCVGLVPRDRIAKSPSPGDAIVLIGGRTGRDGIHGATFSSAELTTDHGDEFAHAVQIGNPIEEKKMVDVVLQARDQATGCLFSAITDCGAGGLSSAIGEMGEKTGAEVHLERVPLKYAGLRYDEIWISEAQERMVLAVPPDRVESFCKLAADEDVEATVIGHFTDTNRLVVRYDGTVVGDLDMQFLHDGLPSVTKSAEWRPRETRPAVTPTRTALANELRRQLSRPTVASKHWLIHQYDHEVQAGSVVKPLAGSGEGPSDGAVIRPKLDSNRGVALACGLAPDTPDADPYWTAVASIDEAVRNIVCVGGDPRQAAILDNFCWPSSDDVHALGALVRTCQACYDASKAYGLPFISGKDSLNNVFAMSGEEAAFVRQTIQERYPTALEAFDDQQVRHPNRVAVPGTLLISAMALVEDVNRCISSAPCGDDVRLFYVGVDTDSWQDTSLERVPSLHATIADRIQRGAIRAAHDCSEGGVAVAVAEMALCGCYQTTYSIAETGLLSNPFVEPPSGYIVQAENAETLADIGPGMLIAEIARLSAATTESFTFRTSTGDAVGVDNFRQSWHAPLDW